MSTENVWQGLYDRLRLPLMRRRREPPVGVRFVRRPTVRSLDAYEARSGFRLPASYRQFVLLFGPGELGYVRLFCPGYPREGFPVDLDAGDRGFHERWARMPDADLAEQYGDVARARRLVNFADTGGGDEYGWDPQDVTDAAAPEYGVYILSGPSPPLRRVAASFREFAEDALRRYEAGFPEAVPFSPASRTSRRRRRR